MLNVTQIQEDTLFETDTLFAPQYNLIVWNDDVNTFQWVIETLIDYCEMDFIQAEQCSLIIHNTGKCAVYKADYEILKTKKEDIIDRGINATIEELVS